MAGPEVNKQSVIKSLLAGRSKSHRVYDGSNRLIELYEAPVESKTGDICLVTRFSYLSPTALEIENTFEDVGVWDNSWDI